ncbi:transcriptional regulator [Paenibacillus cellulosilyticus]|uniref:Transcriptional regulator n=1 Tax=Paenibacillus cellulosilyticus TaxID=375489 RepID=A0A2V2YYE0_9BACL|nr:ROK family protein [Paenibacillus cellulosilyticus]PWW04742.1 transcriptional regulator [Paenibacillus cellulosilyticus]QKS45867.1 ROK family protein [Paenibacillus cellulosilyticus]
MTDIQTSPKELKKAITQRIRAALIMMGSATKADLCQRLGISFPTISKFLTQMEMDGEIHFVGEDDSSGGRRAKRYAYDPEFMLGLAIFVEKTETNYTIFNCVGEIKEEGRMPSVLQADPHLLGNHIESLIERFPRLRSAAVGVPGAVSNGQIIFIPPYPNFLDNDLKEAFESRFQIPVIIENDMNASVLGFAANNEIENESLVYMYFGQDGPGSGIMINGDVVRGSTFFSGEIALVPQNDNKSFVEALKEGASRTGMVPTGESQIDAVARLIATFTAITNPKAIIFCNDEIDETLLAQIKERSATYVPRKHLPALLKSDFKEDYLSGLQHLALDLMITGSDVNESL